MLNDNKKVIPKVIFKNKKIEDEISEWITQSTISTHNVDKSFGLLLKICDIEPTETCTLSSSEYGYQCYLKNAKETANILLYFGDNEDYPKFLIRYQNVEKLYDYYPKGDNRDMHFELQRYEAQNPINGNVYTKYPLSSQQILQNGITKLLIDIKLKDNEHCLADEENLKQYLLNLAFPIEIESVYKRICEYHLSNINCAVIRLEITRENKITDLISVVDGQWEQFTKTKNGKTVSIYKSNKEYSYHDETKQYQQGVLNIQIPTTLCGVVLNSTEVLEEIEREVQKVRCISQTIFKN